MDKNLTDWKKPYLMEQFDEEEEGEEQAEASVPKGKKGKLAKHTTMKGTAKVNCAVLSTSSVCLYYFSLFLSVITCTYHAYS